MSAGLDLLRRDGVERCPRAPSEASLSRPRRVSRAHASPKNPADSSRPHSQFQTTTLDDPVLGARGLRSKRVQPATGAKEENDQDGARQEQDGDETRRERVLGRGEN